MRPTPGPGLGTARAGGRGGAGACAVRHPLPGLHRQALPREAGIRAQLRAHPPQHPGRPPVLSPQEDGPRGRPADPPRTGGGVGAPAAGPDDDPRAWGSGKSLHPESFGNWFRERCTEAGLPHCSAHGLRKAGARRLAEAGASEFEVMAFLAHRTAQEASRYVAKANRATLTTSGLAKLSTNPEQKLSNLSRGWTNWALKLLKYSEEKEGMASPRGLEPLFSA